MHVFLSAHAARQLEELGSPANQALRYIRQLEPEEIEYTAQSLPPQQGREVWMLWAGSVRVLFDTEDDDLTIQGFGLRPPF